MPCGAHPRLLQRATLIWANVIGDNRWVFRPSCSHTLVLQQSNLGRIRARKIKCEGMKLKGKIGYVSGSISQWWEWLRSEFISLKKQLKFDDEEHVEMLWIASGEMDRRAAPGCDDALAWIMPAHVPSPAVTSMSPSLISGLAEVWKNLVLLWERRELSFPVNIWHPFGKCTQHSVPCQNPVGWVMFYELLTL